MRLIITEKPSVSRSIASVLGATQKREGYVEGNGFIISWCAGHLLELAAPDAYDKRFSKWRYADLPLIPDKWKYAAIKGKAAQLKILADLMKRPDVECVINACDAGREGENIFRSVYAHAKCKKKIMRLWISSLENTAIRAGFDKLADGKVYDNLAAAASCRERADWLVGISATRLFSVLYGGLLNTGRVQSPTLAMLVKRDTDISGFVKTPFYTPVLDCTDFAAPGTRLDDKQAAEEIRADCDGKTAVVRSVERQKKNESPPKLYDLTALQRDANRLLGFTAAQTLEYSQSMYERAILSYPRVDSRYLTSDMRGTATDIVAWLQSNSPHASGMDFTPDIDRLIDDERVTDHHAIIPTAGISKTDISALASGERDILNLVSVRMICAVAPTHTYETVTTVLDCEGHTFTAKGKIIINDGWKAIDAAFRASLKAKPEAEGDSEESEEEIDLPGFSEGQTFPNVAVTVKEGFTTPPRPYTEDTLLQSMESAGAEDMPDDAERRGLGTPATRAAIIEKLVKSGFVERQKKNLIPTDKGKNLIAVLPDTLISPKLTAEWEHKLMQIQRGETTETEFMNGITAFIKAIVAENNTPKPEFTGLFGESKKSAAEPLGSCPRCNAAIREGSKGFFCDTHSCGFKLWKESKFWTTKKKPLTAAIVTALLKEGRAAVNGLYSERTGKKYDAVVVLDDTGDKYVNYKMEFK
jgi:DNA topoisomerase-3